MTTMISEVYDALISAGADKDRSRRAAEALTQSDSRFGSLESKIAVLGLKIAALELKISEFRGEMTERMARMDGRIATQSWMLGFIFAFIVAITFKLFIH